MDSHSDMPIEKRFALVCWVVCIFQSKCFIEIIVGSHAVVRNAFPIVNILQKDSTILQKAY